MKTVLFSRFFFLTVLRCFEFTVSMLRATLSEGRAWWSLHVVLFSTWGPNWTGVSMLWEARGGGNLPQWTTRTANWVLSLTVGSACRICSLNLEQRCYLWLGKKSALPSTKQAGGRPIYQREGARRGFLTLWGYLPIRNSKTGMLPWEWANKPLWSGWTSGDAGNDMKVFWGVVGV